MERAASTLSLFRPRRERRALSLQDVWGSGGDWPTIRQTGAMALPAAYACVRLIAASIASMPIEVYRERVTGRPERVPAPSLLTAPCRRETPFAWKYRAGGALALRGNAYGLLDAQGTPTQLAWLDPNLVTVNDQMYPDQAPEYWYRSRRIDPVHIAAFVEPGSVRGLSPIANFRRLFDAGLAPQEYGLAWFENGGQPQGLLETEKRLDDDDVKTLKSRWRKSREEGGIAVLGQGATYKPLQVNADEAQFLEAQKFNATQVARIFGVPPEMIGADSGNSMTYQNREQRAIDFVTFTLPAYTVPIEEHLTALLPPGMYVRLNADRLLRSDRKSRLEANAVGIASWQLTPEEARAEEDRPPLTDEQITQLQAVPISVTPQGRVKSSGGV